MLDKTLNIKVYAADHEENQMINTIEYKLYVQNKDGVILNMMRGTSLVDEMPEVKDSRKKRPSDFSFYSMKSNDIRRFAFKLESLRAGYWNFREYLDANGWSVSSFDTSQAKGDRIAAKYRDTWNLK